MSRRLARHPRRVVLAGFMAMIFARLFPERLVRSQESEPVDIQWRVPEEQIETVREQLNFDGEIIGDPSTIDEDRGLPLIYIFAGIFALDLIVKTLLEVYRDARYGGIIIRKNQEGKLLIENDSRLDPGIIVIDQGDEIKVILRENEQPKPKDIVEALTPLVKK